MATAKQDKQPADDDPNDLNRRIAEQAAKATTAEARAKTAETTAGE